MSSQSLYAPYKVVGYVCDSVPYAMQELGGEWFITVSVGRSFQVFKVNKLYACLVSEQAPGDITRIQVKGHETYVSVGQDIFIYKRARIVKKLSAHNSIISELLCVGGSLISVDLKNTVKVFDETSWDAVSEMRLQRKARVTVIMHPATYINKVIVGFEDGCLELWNINKKKLIYQFEKHVPMLGNMKTLSNSHVVPKMDCTGVSCVEQSPACDVVGVGLSTGLIILLNLRLDFVLFSFQQEGGAVTSLSFRADAVAEQYPYLVSGSEDGRLHIWNLGDGDEDESDAEESANFSIKGSKRKLQSTIEEAHVDAVSRVAFLHGEPVMISAGASDNSLKVWIFDSPDGTTARLLRSRCGHRGNPTKIRYYGGVTNVSMRDNADATSCELVSVGADCTVRVFNTAIEAQNRELSQKPLLKKLGIHRRNERLPPCIGFDFCETRQRDWGNLVTIHEGSPNAYVWKYKHKVSTEMVLRQPHTTANGMKHKIDEKMYATAVGLSPCGNFCVVGCRNGVLFRYNLQSGLQRGAYPKEKSFAKKESALRRKANTPGNVYHIMKEVTEDVKQPAAVKAPGAGGGAGAGGGDGSTDGQQQSGHRGEVTGIFISMMGTRMVSCGLDGMICFWDFLSHDLIQVVQQPSLCPHLFLCGFRDADFVAFAGQDRTIRMYDLQTESLARRFSNGHSRELTDMAFGSDGRRLLSAAMDSTLRVWDIPSGRCISWLLFSSPLLSIAVSLSGEYLCVAQADKEGIFMYIDRSLYESVHFWKEPTAPTPVDDSKVTSDWYGALDQDAAAEEAYGGAKKRVDSIDADESDDAAELDIAADVIGGGHTAPPMGDDSIVMSGVPRAYWTSLFFLEAIKQRSKPTLPPSKPAKAPFFLPSLVREGGSAPSFPTPEEFAKLRTDIAAGVAEDASKKKRKRGEEGAEDEQHAEEPHDMSAFEGLASAWDDDENAAAATAATAAEEEEEQEPDQPGNASIAARTAGSTAAPAAEQGKHKSRILRREAQLPRCKMEAYLLQLSDEKEELGDSSLLAYLKQLAPPAVDLEFRSLCLNEEDADGVALLQKLIRWTMRQIETGRDYELLQAYLHRFLTIYSELISSQPQLAADITALKRAQFDANVKFRHLLQKNLCLLKMTGNIPIT